MAAQLHSRITGKLVFFAFNALLIICILCNSASPALAQNEFQPTPGVELTSEVTTPAETLPPSVAPTETDTPTSETTPIPTESPTLELPTETPSIENTLPEISAQSGPSILYVAPSANCGGQMPCYATIQDAVDDAVAGDTVKVAEGTYTSPSFEIVYLNKAITLMGGYAVSDWSSSDPINHPSILDSQNQLGTRGITVDGTTFSNLITVTGFSITNGYLPKEKNGGGVNILGGNVLLENNLISGNLVNGDHSYRLGYGAGVYVLDGNVTIKNNQITLNSTYAGGGIYIANGTINIINNTISNNTNHWGGGGGISINGGDCTISNNIINNNSGEGMGGIRLSGGTGIVENNLIDGNSVSIGDGAGIYVNNGNYEIKNNTISNNINSGYGNGGGIAVNGSAKITGNLIKGNYSASESGGAGIAVRNSNGFFHTSIVGNTFIENSTLGTGGAIYVQNPSTIINGNIFLKNIAVSHGSAIAVVSAGSIQGQNNIIAQNTGATEAVYIESSTVSIDNWTIANNGKYGVVSDGSSTTTITNSIFFNHTVAAIYGSKITSNYSLFYPNQGRCSGGAICTNDVLGDPKFYDATNGDYHLTAGSAALDAGINAGVSIDIDGESRPKGAGYDIGADELIEPPMAGFTNTEEFWIGPAIVFSNTTVENGNTTYLWDFGDGTSSTQVNPSHSYALPGTYTVTLTATNFGGSNSITGLITIPNFANFNSSSPDWLGEATSFTNATESNGETTFVWDFGDGTSSSEENPTHTFSAAGTYQVSLVATNAEGSGTKTEQVTIFGSPLPSFTSSSPDWLGQTTSFVGSAITSPTGDTSITSSWDFGDGSTISGNLSPEHFYSTAGTYQVTLTVTNAAGSNSIQNEVVIQAPVIQFSSISYEVNEGAGEKLMITQPFFCKLKSEISIVL